MYYVKRFAKLIFGLFLFAFGFYLSIQANIGLSSWNAFNIGVADKLGTTYGVISIATAIVIMGIDVLLKESIGWGTVFDAFLVGIFVDTFTALNIVPMINNFWIGLAVLVVGTEVIAIGSWFYISSALGAGPRDTLMVALCKKFPNVKIGIIRTFIEAFALIIGWLCGAKVGFGTVVSVFGTGFFIQWTFAFMKFDVKYIVNENVIETIHNILNKKNDPSL